VYYLVILGLKTVIQKTYKIFNINACKKQMHFYDTLNLVNTLLLSFFIRILFNRKEQAAGNAYNSRRAHHSQARRV